MSRIASIQSAIEDIRLGKMVILVDDEDRENEGDLVIAAERVTPEAIAFMAEHGRGLICLAMANELVDRLELPPMAASNQAPLSTAFTQSIDAISCAGSGVSAADRALTIAQAIAPGALPDSFRVPGHVFPLRARSGGVLVRSGQTEGSVDLARLADLEPAGVICEVMAQDGTMSRLDSLLDFGAEHDIKVVTVADLIEYRVQSEPMVVAEAHSELPTRWGVFDLTVFRSAVDGAAHVAMTLGEMRADEPTLVRVHRSNLLSDTFGLQMSRSRNNLDAAMEAIGRQGRGVFIHLAIAHDAGALANVLNGYVERASDPSLSLKTQASSKKAMKPAEKMDFREFGVGAQILRELGLGKIRVLTNHPRRLRGVAGFGLEIVEWLPVGGPEGAVDTESGTPS